MGYSFFTFAYLTVCINLTYVCSSKSILFNIIPGLRLKPAFLTLRPLLNKTSACSLECLSNSDCVSASYSPSLGLCELSSVNLYDDGVILESDENWRVLYRSDYEKELIFRATAYCGISVYDTWTGTNRETLPESTSVCLSMQTNECNTHFRSYLLDQWENIGIEKVMLELYTDGEKVADIVFNGTDSNMFNWFSQDRLIESSLDNLLDGPFNKFSILGENGCGRRFYINRHYNGCDNDTGWLCVTDALLCCTWDQMYPLTPSFRYSNGTVTWASGGPLTADVFAVFIKRQPK